ncbi:MAG: glycosyltransferase family 4 protein [Bacteroidota bacterium]
MKKQKTKIAIVANSTWNIYNFRLNLVELLDKEQYELLVIAPVDHYISYLNKYPKVRHIHLHKLSRKSTNPLKDLALMQELYQIYKTEKPDLVIHYTVKPNIYGGFAAKMAGVKYLSTITGLGYTFIHNGLVKKITKELYRLAFQHSEKIVFENTDDRLMFIQEQISTSDKSISIKGCGVNIDHFSPNGYIKQKDKVIFTFIGRLLHDKGIAEFVEAARQAKAQCPNTEFWVIGDIDNQNPAAISQKLLVSWMQEKVIRYFGPTDDVRYFIKRSDCIVLPSYREAIPRVVQEGMAMKKPIITTDTPGCREAVDEGKNGFLVPIKDAYALATAMTRFYALDEKRISAMGDYSRDKAVSEFDDRLIAQQLLDVIEGIL